MAMDDFASSSELGNASAAPDLDEDLFDFPSPEDPEPAPEAVALPDPAPASAQAPTTQASGYTGMDPDLDQDIFDFPPLEQAAGLSPATIAGGDLEASIDEATATVNELLEDDLGEMIQDHHEELERQLAEEENLARTVPPTASDVPAASTSTPVAQQVIVTGPTSRTQRILVGALVVFMVAVIGLSWRMNESFNKSLGRVRDDVAQDARKLKVENAEQQHRITELEAELLAQRELAEQAATSTAAAITTQLSTPSELTLLAAQSTIESGEFAEARQMLYRDLATADTIPAEERDGVIQRMEVLIARSYKLQAEGLPEAEL